MFSATASCAGWIGRARRKFSSPSRIQESKYQESQAMVSWFTSIDRKSTRLNSSHLVISYAVFCLKKKNIKQGRYSFQYTQAEHCFVFCSLLTDLVVLITKIGIVHARLTILHWSVLLTFSDISRDA